jgi:hypothetical protein
MPNLRIFETFKINILELNKNIVGIDFSINSPAFCCYKDGKYTWGSLTRSDRSAESLMKNAKKPFSILDTEPDFKLIFLDKKELPDDYTGKERIKIVYFLEIVESLWASITEIMGDSDFYVAMEGLSFSSNGNALIDISMATALLREKIINTVGVERFFVFSPTSIKKFALKGNAKKDELYDALCIFRENDETNLIDFSNILEVNKTEWVTPAKAVNKPIDDIVDSTWITLYLKEQLKEIYGIKGNFKPASKGSL